MRSLLFATVFLTFVAGTACPPSSAQPLPEDAGTAAFVGRACNVDAECGALRCDKVRRQCICLSDESCASEGDSAPRYCNNYTGLCVAEIVGCKSDGDCQDASGKIDPTTYCDSSVRACRPRKSFCQPCESDPQCGGERDRCLLDAQLGQKFCGKTCELTSDCPRGAACVEVEGSKQCQPAVNPLAPGEPASCASFKGCTPDSLRTCNVSADCADLGGQRCDPAQGRCVAVDQVCPFGTVCDPRNKICVAECAVDSDCGDGTLRCTNRICEPVSECESDSQCPANKVCSLVPGQTVGQCLPFCQGDGDCPLGKVCRRGADNRYRCEPGCSPNEHRTCPLDQRCNASTRTCEGPEVGNIRICQASVACAPCQLCNLAQLECVPAKASYPYCLPCSGDAECTGGACVQMGDGRNYCARYCGSGQECPQGFVCLPIGNGSTSACVPADRQCQGKCL